MKHTTLIALSVILLACNAPSDTHVNKDIIIDRGETVSGSLRSVNGTIRVEHEAVVEGNCSTVNGAINIGENCEVGELSCVNGAISVDRNSHVEAISCVNGDISLGSEVSVKGDVSTVNGEITLKLGSSVEGDLSTVNGAMRMTETLIAGKITTVNGHIDLLEKSLVEGDIIIKRDGNKHKTYKNLVITIDGKSKVKGNIEVRGDEPNVTVVLAGGGEVLGEIINAELVRK